MPFVDQILKYGTLSIVGLEKNTGKTECLNYILKRLPSYNLRTGITSIGIDGEKVDQVTQGSKPEIFLGEGIIFSTSEKHYRERKIFSEILDIGDTVTSLGRVITARSLQKGKVLLSGPATTSSLVKWIKQLKTDYKTDLCIIDGALSRLSLASPVVAESMILATGAALSSNIKDLVNKTTFVTGLIEIPLTLQKVNRQEELPEKGIWGVNKDGSIEGPVYESSFSEGHQKAFEMRDFHCYYVAGAVTDRLLKLFIQDERYRGKEIIVRDFTRLFITATNWSNFNKGGGILTVLMKSKLIAICVNPLAPNGIRLNSSTLCKELSSRVNVPVYDILTDGYKV